MKLHAMVLVLAAAVALPGLASVTNLSLSGTAYGWQAAGTQGVPGNVNTGSYLTESGTWYGSVEEGLVDGYFYILWDDSRTVQSARWMSTFADTQRGLSSFTLWSLNDGADPEVPASWTKLGDYGDFDNPSSIKLYYEVVLPQAITTKAIKLSYTDQYRPLTGEFEIYSRDMTRLATTISDASPSRGDSLTDKALDGTVFTRYGSEGLGNGPGFMDFDLGGEQAVGALQIYFSIQGGYYAAPESFVIQAWNDDDGEWTDVRTVTDWPAMGLIYSLDLDTAVVTEKIRLNVTGPRASSNYADGSFGVSEFYLYAPVVPEPVTLSLLTIGGLALLRRRV